MRATPEKIRLTLLFLVVVLFAALVALRFTIIPEIDEGSPGFIVGRWIDTRFPENVRINQVLEFRADGTGALWIRGEEKVDAKREFVYSFQPKGHPVLQIDFPNQTNRYIVRIDGNNSIYLGWHSDGKAPVDFDDKDLAQQSYYRM